MKKINAVQVSRTLISTHIQINYSIVTWAGPPHSVSHVWVSLTLVLNNRQCNAELWFSNFVIQISLGSVSSLCLRLQVQAVGSKINIGL